MLYYITYEAYLLTPSGRACAGATMVGMNVMLACNDGGRGRGRGRTSDIASMEDRMDFGIVALAL